MKISTSWKKSMPSLTSVHRQDAPSEITPLLPPRSAAPNMSSKFIATFRVPVCIVVLYFCSGYIFALPFAVVYLFLGLLEPLIPDAHDAHLLFPEWTFCGFVFRMWFLLFMLGISVEVLTYAGWLLMGVLRKREDGGDQEYGILALRVWWAVTIAIPWTMDKYLRLVAACLFIPIGRITIEGEQAWIAQVD
ncbi:hypothetical protein LARI1_G005478 [Lachnellula arida]|uniref:Uncharacterized protein n=1 Tax=Lachnellula arida TaxID=1316785 RepID=A0A8T9BDT9_9HELO|nr:hypothetical protein LARI1_G005478 [Lachnellula arida]